MLSRSIVFTKIPQKTAWLVALQLFELNVHTFYSLLDLENIQMTQIKIPVMGKMVTGLLAYLTISLAIASVQNFSVGHDLGPKNQKPFEQYILDLAPKRVIFNPGTEHLAFQERLQKAGISCEIACTLVLLRTHQFETLLNE